jgi:hypothetical protein
MFYANIFISAPAVAQESRKTENWEAEGLRDHPDMLLQEWEDSLRRVRYARWRQEHQDEISERAADYADRRGVRLP